jgi:hypothetical protein
MSITILQVHKRSSYEFKFIQDKYAISSDNSILALADGTTQSFNSEIWAELITSQFVQTPNFTPSEVIKLFRRCVGKFKNSHFEFSINPAKASLEKFKQSKGATATFIALNLFNDKKLELIACGDSNFFKVTSENNLIAYPFSDLDSLDANNNFINTEALIQEKVENSYFSVKSFEYKYGDNFILATDALSRLLITTPEVYEELLQIENFEQLNLFCSKYWENKNLQEDDISAIILKIDNKSSRKTIFPPNGFSFPKEAEQEFIPDSLIQNENEIKYTDMQMNEIRTQFNGIANDFLQVKKKQKFHEILIMVAISLILLSLIYFAFFQKNSETEKTNSEIQLKQQLIEKDNIIQSMQKDIDGLNKLLQTKNKDTVTIKKEKKVISKKDTLTLVNKPNNPQNTKNETKGTIKPLEMKKDSTIKNDL